MTSLRLATRALLHRPALTITILATLAIGLGFNVAAGSITTSLLRRPYPYPGLDELAIVHDNHPREGLHQRNPIAAGDFMDLRRLAGAFSGIAGWRPASLVVAGAGAAEPEAIQAIEATANFFDVLGVRAMLGRTFLADEGAAGHDAVVVFSQRVWRARFGEDPQSIGRSVMLNGRSSTVIGVIPDNWAYPSGVDAWIPLVATPADARERIAQRVSSVARIRSDATFDAAQADVARVADDLARAYPDTNRGRGFELMPLRRDQYEFTAPLFLFVEVAALLVLGVGMTNVSSLLLARTIERRHEFAVRTALGASRWRLFRDAMVDAQTLTAVAGAVGVALAFWIVTFIRAALPQDIAKWIAGWQAIRVDLTDAAVGASMTITAGVVLGLVTGAQAARAGAGPIHGGGRGAMHGPGRWRRVVVAAQVCFAVVLVTGAAVALQGFRQMSAAFASLRPAQLLTFDMRLPAWRYANEAQIVDFYDRLLAAIRTMPEIQSAGLIRNPPASNVPTLATPFVIGREVVRAASDAPRAEVQIVTADAFRTLDVAIIDGRGVTIEDSASSPRVAVISQTMARRFWRDRDPLGATLRLGLTSQAHEVRVIGVVADVRLNWYDPQPQPVVYLPHPQSPARDMTAIVRATVDPASLAARIRSAIHGLDSQQPIGAIERYTDVIDSSLSPVRIIGILLTTCGVVATLLAATGVNGVLAQWVASQRREFGVRLALGADRSRVMRSVVFETVRITAVGVAIALPLAWAGTVAARTAALGLAPVSAGVTATIAVSAFVVAIAASLGPALRASLSDPARLLQD